jgi:hypothetical protein
VLSLEESPSSSLGYEPAEGSRRYRGQSLVTALALADWLLEIL